MPYVDKKDTKHFNSITGLLYLFSLSRCMKSGRQVILTYLNFTSLDVYNDRVILFQSIVRKGRVTEVSLDISLNNSVDTRTASDIFG